MFFCGKCAFYLFIPKASKSHTNTKIQKVGELVGARLLAHAGSLVNLAKYPASTVQILGAEKALFRALKTNSDTPKYGLIYHAMYVTNASTTNKAKIARTLACKTALATRVDAFTAQQRGSGGKDIPMAPELAFDLSKKMESRLNKVEGRKVQLKSKTLGGTVFTKHQFQTKQDTYDPSQDIAMTVKQETSSPTQQSKKRKLEKDVSESGDSDTDQPKHKKQKTEATAVSQSTSEQKTVATEETEEQRKKREKKEKKKLKKQQKALEALQAQQAAAGGAADAGATETESKVL